MKHEAKLAIIFIGILGASFAILLVKRLSHPGNKNLAYGAQPVNVSADNNASKLSAAVAPPTLVTPKSENSRPPELAPDTTTTSDTGSSWSRSARATSPDYSQATPDYSSQRQPALASDTAPALTNRTATTQAADPFQANSSTTAQPYQSGYANTGDPVQQSTAAAAQPYASQAAPAAARTTPTDNTHYGYAASQHGATTAASDWRTDTTTQQSNVPVAGYGYNSPATSTGSANATQHVNVFPVASADTTAATQRYATSNVTGAGAGPVTQVSGIERRGEEYSIEPNDSFWGICQKAYGNGAFFKALREYNRKRHPEADDMRVGEKLAVPDEVVLRRAYPDLCPKPHRQTATVQQRLASASGRMRENSRVYTVVEGDTLFEIARRELGKPSRWGEVYELNRDVLGNDFDYLKPGLELILPDTRKQTENVTRQPSDFYQR